MGLYFLNRDLSGGGAERVMLRLLDRLPVRRLILLEEALDYALDGERVSFLSPRFLSRPILVDNFKYLCTLVWGRSLSRELSPGDTVVSFSDRAHLVNAWAKLFCRHTAVISVHSLVLDERSESGVGRMSPWRSRLYSRGDLLLAVSGRVKLSLVLSGIPEDKIRVLPNPIDVDSIRGMAEEEVEEVFEGIPFVVNVARLGKEKGHRYLLAAFRELRERRPEVRLLLIGKGALKDDLVRLSESMNLRTYVWDRDELTQDFDVYFLGFRENPFKYVSRARLFVLSSLHEALPNVILESLACGVPVVSVDCPSGPREILAPDTDFNSVAEGVEFCRYGVLTPPFRSSMGEDGLSRASSELARAMEALLEDEGLRSRYSSLGLRRAREFDCERVIGLWREVLGLS